MSNSYTTLRSKKTTILLDPDIEQALTLEEHDYVILTHLDFDAVDFLTNYAEQKPVYVSFEFFKLMQKLIKVNLVENIQTKLAILPYNYPVQLGDIQIHALSNDDGLFGSLALMAKGANAAVGYCDAFYLHGNHNKRIKTWKKAFRDAHLTTLLLGSRIAPFAKKENQLSENGMQEMLTKFISKNSAAELLTVLLSPWDPERLYRYDKTAKNCHRPIIWNHNYFQLLQAFYPFADFYNAQNLPQDSAQVLVQVEQSRQLNTMPVFLDPALLHPHAIDSTGLIYQQPLCALSEAELHEFTAFVGAENIIMKTDKSLEFERQIPAKWQQELLVDL